MEWLSLDMLAHVYYIVVKTYSLQTKGYIHSIYHSGLFYRPEKVSHTQHSSKFIIYLNNICLKHQLPNIGL